MLESRPVYFPGLNGVRFIAAFLVLLDHTELFKGYFGYKVFWPEKTSAHLGSLGVTIFFVLSGYLITYLLLMEKRSSISIKNFYIRRILRIWPLYYLIVVLSFFIIPHINFFSVPFYTEDINQNFALKLTLFSCLVANVAFVFLPTVAFGNVLWSVSVEEQFYLIWPHIIKYFKNTLLALISLLAIYMIVRTGITIDLLSIKKFLPHGIDELMERTRISCMIIGGIGAYIVFNKISFITNIIFSRYIQIAVLATFMLIFFDLIHFPFYGLVKTEFTAFVIMLCLLNISCNPKSLVKLENFFFIFLGKISYGIYVYHLFAVVICIRLFSNFYPSSFGSSHYLWDISLLVSITILTILIANISYVFLESKILKRKIKYSTVISGDQVKSHV
jgi:peptidoglycan/LPS O-acetylase OafA/YrhL